MKTARAFGLSKRSGRISLALEDTSYWTPDVWDGHTIHTILPSIMLFQVASQILNEKSILYIFKCHSLQQNDILIFLYDKSMSMAWIFNISRTCVINSNHIQAAYYRLQPEFIIRVSVTGEEEGSSDAYLIYEKTDVEEEMILKRIQKLHEKKWFAERALLATELSTEEKLKRQNQLQDLTRELYNCTVSVMDHQKNKADPNYKEIFQKFLGYLSDPNFHASNNLYDFSEIL
jgi:hypothetical protein